MKVLFAVDGSDYTTKAANYLATHFPEGRQELQLRLLNVQLPIPKGLALSRAGQLLGKDVEDRYYKEEAESALSRAEDILRANKVPFESSYRVGDIAGEIMHCASEYGADMIVMGSHGHGALRGLVAGSVATKVLALATVPVLIVR